MKTVQIVCYLCYLLFLSARVVAFDYCYRNCGPKKHVLCDVTKCEQTFCEENEPDYEWRLNMVIDHNRYRAHVAKGLEKRHGLSSATNMMAISYDLNLEAVAGCCLYRFGPDRSRCINTPRFYLIGMNSLSTTSLDPSTIHTIGAAVNMWYEEVTNITKNVIDWYPSRRRQKTNYSHFTQLVWARTSHVGCARCRKGNTFMMMCLYGPSGNIPSAQVYQRGPTASQCLVKPTRKQPALCGRATLPINSSQPGLHLYLVLKEAGSNRLHLVSVMCAVLATIVWRVF